MISATEPIMSSTARPMLNLRRPRKLKFELWLKISMASLLSDRQGLELAAAVDQRRDGMGHRHRGEHRGEDTDEQRNAEALDRTRAHGHETERGEQVGDVRIENGRPGLVVTGAEGRQRRRAVAQLFADAFADQ